MPAGDQKAPGCDPVLLWLGRAGMVVAAVVGAPLALLIISIPFTLPFFVYDRWEFSQPIPADDEERIIAIAERDLLDSYTFRNHGTKPVPYECKVDTSGSWTMDKDVANYDHIVVCTIPVDCDGYKWELEKVFYIAGIRIPGDYGRSGGERDPKAPSGRIDRNRLNNCDHY